MPRGKELNEYEKGEIDGLSAAGVKPIEIASRIKRTIGVVNNYLKMGPKYGIKKRSGRKSTLSCRDIRHILRLAGTEQYSICQIKNELRLPQHKTTIWRVIKKSPNLKYVKRQHKLALNQNQINARMKFAKIYMSWTEEWNRVVFSDEKKFNLDGPDGLQYYWHDLRKEPQYFSKRAQGGGSVMVWAACAANGKTNLVFINGKIDSKKYQDILQENLVPLGAHIGGKNWMYQQDNATIHVSKSSKEWFTKNKIQLLDWPANSPDLNIMENIWGILVRDVFKNGRQFSSISEIKKQLINSWAQISNNMLTNLVDSMKDRIFSLIEKKGEKIDY